jgi:hypothetical protein
MKVYTYSQARQRLSELLDYAENEEVLIKRRDGTVFIVTTKQISASPFDVPGIETDVSTEDILAAIRESRESYE